MSGEFIYPWVEPSEYELNTVYFGVSSSRWQDSVNIKTIDFADFFALSAVDTPGAYAGTMSVSGVGQNLKLWRKNYDFSKLYYSKINHSFNTILTRQVIIYHFHFPVYGEN